MTKLRSALALSALLALPATPLPAVEPPRETLREALCDTLVSDPFRPLEQLDDPAVLNWMRHASKEARSALEALPGRERLLGKMVEFDGRRKSRAYGLAISDNDHYFYLKRTPEDETGKLYTRQGFKGKERLLFDPATLSTKGESWVVSGAFPSRDGSLVAISVAANGSEDAVILVMESATGTLLPERIDRGRFASPSWLPDGRSFVYTRLRKPQKGVNPQYDSQAFVHVAGTDPSNDRELLSRQGNASLGIAPQDVPVVICDRDSGRLFAFISNVDRRLEVHTAPVSALNGTRIDWQPLISRQDNVHDFAVRDSKLYFLTPEGSPRFRLMRTALDRPDFRNAETIVAEHPDELLTSFGLTSEALYFTRTRNGVEARAYRLAYDTDAPQQLTLPFPAGALHLSTKGVRFPEAWMIMGGWSNDYSRYRHDARKERFVYETISSTADFPEYRNLVVEEVMAPSHDGTEVPLSIIYDKKLRRNGENPVLLYGYGAYGRSVTPFFSPSMLLWTREGGVLAVAHVRGGGELGDAWHEAGMKATKPNTWKDLIGCAEYLVEKGYTQAGKIAVNGASAGGIMVGMAMVERPDLFGAAMPQVGSLNPLRGEETPNGPVNVPEFGSVKDPAECRALIAMDPYLNLRNNVAYPAALVTAGMNDPRVIAWQPAKFAARLMEASNSGKPVLFFADEEAGHGMGNTKTKEFETLADILSFGLWQTGTKGFQPE